LKRKLECANKKLKEIEEKDTTNYTETLVQKEDRKKASKAAKKYKKKIIL